jgi:hypothetical protein
LLEEKIDTSNITCPSVGLQCRAAVTPAQPEEYSSNKSVPEGARQAGLALAII